MITRKKRAVLSFAIVAVITWWAVASPIACGQGSRKDDIVLSASGHPIAGATIRVCQAGATGDPCNPLATIYTDATLTTTAPNPFQGDGIGNYFFYGPAGRYTVQISGPGITSTRTYPDVILAPDVSSSGSGNNISAFGLTLGGNLTVGGNATIDGTLTTTNFNPGTFTPSSLSVAGNETVLGPRPRVDVTAYGAKGDNSTDDTAAIQAALNAVCAYGIPQRPTLFFPPGIYIVSQPQGGASNTNPVFTGWCSGLSVQGSGGNTVDQFAMAPMSRIFVNHGANGGSGPVFEPTSTSGSGSSIRDLNIDGYNQAVYLKGTTASDLNGFTFSNVCMATQTTGDADNVPLKISQVLQVSFKGGCIQAGNGSLDDVLIIGADFGGAEATPSGLIFFDGTGGNFWVGSGIHYDQRVNTCCSGPGNIHVRNVLVEDPTQAIFRVTNSTGNPGASAMPVFSDVELDNFDGSDGSAASVVNFNSSGSVLSGLHMEGDGPGSNSPVAAVVMQGGSLSNCDIRGGGIGLSLATVVDGNGNLLGDCTEQSATGAVSVVNTSNTNRLRTDLGAYSDGSSLEAFAAGNSFSSLNVDPAQGLMLGDGASYGYTAQVYQPSKETLDVGFASTLPPTNVAGTATTGGTLAAGNYYYFIRSTTSSSCSVTSMSAPSLASAGIALSGSNNAIALTWTAAGTGAGTNAGYCIFRGTGTPTLYSSGAQYWSTFVSGANTTSFTDTGSGFGCCDQVAPFNAMQSVHRFTATSLGIDTTNPQFNLDVNGSAAVNSLNSVQKAERFSGSDAAAKINACLSAAATSSGLCDARGLTGQVTGSSHLTIPAGTTLLWGQAQLTINDSTTKDAIELGGDGASVIGYQETGTGTVPRPDASGFIACGIAGCTTVDNPSASTRNVDWVHIHGMYLQATGANSTVLNLTSVGHADIENNRFVLGTGGGSYGIYGNTSTGDLDSTNSLIKHNEFDPQSQNDTCSYLAGVFNSIVMEQNSCYLPAENTGTQGFVFAKDSNGNYPDNDEFYGNDCEAASASFGQICFNIIGAQSVVIGPNNRCENVYNCFQFPADGSAVGIHLLDPYISLSSNTVIKPNEPATAMVAIDNNGHNWLPSMHFGMNDLAGPNLIGNAGFEGWQNSTTLYWWGGASGTNINQPGSGIYAQETSAGANPSADAYTQGTYNVRVGDGATAGLGINSGCIQVDSTLEYTLMFRVASGSTSTNFRPGFRFYSDANCTEANKITNIATNARVLTPANYAGTSSLAGTGANWQSTNASLTYNNGITCNCSVTGADWQVATANTWTATRNYGITFRVPNAYSSSSTTTHSMRVFLLENTAAANNYVYFDDVVLSEGPVSTDVTRVASLPDSGSGGTVNAYGSYNFAGNLSLQANTGFSGTLTHNDTANRTYTLPDASGTIALQASLPSWGFQHAGSGQGFSANGVKVWGVVVPYAVSFSHIDYDVSTLDSSGSDDYDIGLYGPCAVNTSSCPLVTHIGAQNLSSTGYKQASVTAATLQPGLYWIAITGNAATAQVATTSVSEWTVCPSTNSSTTSSGGALPSTISTPNCSAPQWTGAPVIGMGLE
jgi:hypothetical protein